MGKCWMIEYKKTIEAHGLGICDEIMGKAMMLEFNKLQPIIEINEYPSNPLAPIREVWEKYKREPFNWQSSWVCTIGSSYFTNPPEDDFWQAICKSMAIAEGKEQK